MSKNHNCNSGIAKKLLKEAAEDPKNISFLVRCIGISLIITSILASLSVGVFAGGAIKSYIISKIETR